MSHSKITISQSMSKIMNHRLPEKSSPNILNKSNNISQSSKTSRVLDESFHNNSKLHNTSGLEIRHFLNLLNITDEDPKNLPPKSQTKSPIKNATSFVQINTSPITKRASPTKKPLLVQSSDHHKSFTNRSFISHPAESMNTIYEDKSITDPPSPTFYNPSHSILNKRSSMDGDRSFNNAKTSSQPNLCRSARNSILGGLGETTPTKKSPMAGKALTRPPSINTISGDIKKVSYSKIVEKDSKSKEPSPFQKNMLNSSMYSTQSISMIENIKSSSEKEKARSNNKSPLAGKLKGSSSYQEGFNMKSVLEDVLDFPEKVKMMHNMIPKEKSKKVNNGDSLNAGYSKVVSQPQNAYNDILNKKFGGIPQKANFFGTSKGNTEYKAKHNAHGSMNEISESTILDMILNSTTTTMHTEKKKNNVDGTYTKVGSLQMIESRPLIKEVSLDVMNQIPKGILVNKSIERKPKSKPVAQENRPREKAKAETVLKNKVSTEPQVNTTKVITKPPEEKKQFDRKESIFSGEPSEDNSSILQSPLQVACDDEDKKSKSMISLNLQQRRSSSTKPTPKEEKKVQKEGPQGQKLTRGRSNAIAVLERSNSQRRATKAEEMDGKSVKTRKENKEFIELLNKLSKNNHMDQIQAMFGKDEESLVKDLVEYIQTQNLSIGRARSNSISKRMTMIEKKLEEVKAKMPSLSALGFEEDKSDTCSENKTFRSTENAYSPAMSHPTPTNKEEEKTSHGQHVQQHRTKRSSFSLEAAKKISTTTHVSSINDIQNPEAGTMQHLLVPMSNNQSQKDTPNLGPLSLQNIPFDKKELLKLESARGVESKTEIKTPNSKENNSKGNSPESEKKETTEAVVELPAFGRTSTLHTQESTSSSLVTVAIETPPSQERRTLPILDSADTKQDNQSTTSNIEPGLGSPSLLFSVLSAGSNNKPALPTPIVTPPPNEQSSPSRNSPGKTEENHNQLKPTLQRSEFQNGSFGVLPQPNEPTRTTQEPPKFGGSGAGGLSSLTFKPPLPTTHTENSPKPGLSLSMLVHMKKKLKPVYIEKLDPENLKATVYGEIHEKEHPGVSFGDLHDLFENAPLNKPAAAPAQPKKELKSLIIDGKRAQNMSILAMKFRKMPINEFRDAIINIDPAILTSDTCSTLLPFCPLPDEIKACQNNKEPHDKLDTASQFLLGIYDIPQLGARLRSTIFKNEFKERLDTVLDAINKVKTACDILKDNVHFKVFLRLSLEVANTLNEGTARGSALGLKPASLLSFDTVRSNKPGLTLLVYMAQKIFEQKPEILDFTADFAAGINDATKINILDPIRSLQELKKDMNQLRLQLEISMDKNPPDTGFSNAFKSFYDSSAPLLVEAEERYNKTNEHYAETAKFLGEDDDSLKKKTSMEFFKVFKHLADTVEKFKSDEVEKKKREARRAAMKKVEKQPTEKNILKNE